jgi:hypothetical protein
MGWPEFFVRGRNTSHLPIDHTRDVEVLIPDERIILIADMLHEVALRLV